MYILLCILFCLRKVESEENYCYEFGALDPIFKFYSWHERDIFMRWDEDGITGIDRKVSTLLDVADLADRMPNLLQKTKKIAKENPAMLRTPVNSFEKEHLVIPQAELSVSGAYDACHADVGSFPSPKTQEEEQELPILAYKYQVRHIYVDASLDPSLVGPTSSNGYIYAYWDHRSIIRPTADDLKKSDFRHVLLYIIDIDTDPKNPSVVWWGTVFNDKSTENRSYLCLEPAKGYELSVDQVNAMESVTNTLSIQSTQIMNFASDKGRILAEMVKPNLTALKTEEEIYPAGEIFIGIEAYLPLLYPMKAEQYYKTVGIDHINEINQLNSYMKETLKNIHEESEWISMTTNPSLKRILGESGDFRSSKTGISANHLLSTVQFKINHMFDGFVSNVTIRSISSGNQVQISKIRKFTNSEGKHLIDNYIVENDDETFSSKSLPKGQECTTFGVFKACRDVYLASQPGGSSVKSNACGKNLAQHGSTRGCQMEEVEHPDPYLLAHVKCSGNDGKGFIRYYDILNANFDGEITRDCDGERTDTVNFTKGHTALPTKRGNCNYYFKDQLVYGLEEGDSIPDEEKLHETIFGTYSIKDIKWILYSSLSVGTGIILSLIIGFCPRVRIWISRQCFCCCTKGMCKVWQRQWKSNCEKCRTWVTGEDMEKEMDQIKVEHGIKSKLTPVPLQRQPVSYGTMSNRDQRYPPNVVMKRPRYPEILYDPRCEYQQY